MSRADRNDLRDRLDEIEDTLTGDENTFTVTSCEVVTLTPDMVDDSGNTIESKLPPLTGKELEVPSDVVRWTRDDVDAD